MGCRFRFHKFLVKDIEGLFTKLDLSEKFIHRQPVSIILATIDTMICDVSYY